MCSGGTIRNCKRGVMSSSDEAVEERAAIMEFDGNMSREQAELLASLFSDDSDADKPCRCAICAGATSSSSDPACSPVR